MIASVTLSRLDLVEPFRFPHLGPLGKIWDKKLEVFQFLMSKVGELKPTPKYSYPGSMVDYKNNEYENVYHLLATPIMLIYE